MNSIAFFLMRPVLTGFVLCVLAALTFCLYKLRAATALCDECGEPYQRRARLPSIRVSIRRFPRLRRAYLCPACAELERAVIGGTKPSQWLKQHWLTKIRNGDEHD